MENTEPSQLLFLAVQAALQAGKEIMTVYQEPTANFEIHFKEDNSPLTIADKRAHAVIADRLGGTPFPLLSEEGQAVPYSLRSQWKALWVVDPLDGTKEFIKRNGEFTVNIAFVENQVPVLGVVYVPVTRDLYFAATTLGAFKAERVDVGDFQCISELISASIPLPVACQRTRPVVMASRSHLSLPTQEYINKIRERFGDIELISAGSSLKICLVAEGKADIYPRFAPTMEWDTAAGHAVVRSVGMEMYSVSGKVPLLYNKEDLHNDWFVVMNPKFTGYDF